MTKHQNRLILAALAALLFAWPQAARALPAETWLVAIGNNDGHRDEVGLLYAEHDARAFAEVMRLHGHVPSRQTTLLIGEDAAGVRRAIQEVNARIRERTGEGASTALVVFYSGHADATSLHLGSSDLQLDEVKSVVAGSAATVRLLVVDACRSGTVTRVKGVSAAAPFELTLKDQLDVEGLAIMTSSAAGESSQESDRIQGSFFTHHLVNALRGAADESGDGKVTLAEAYAYTYAQTLRSSGDTLLLQHPTYSFDVRGRGQLVLSTPAELEGRLGLLKLGEPAVYLVTEGREGGPVVAEVAPRSEGRALSLPAGRYSVQQRGRNEYREYELEVRPGQEVALGQQPFREVRYDRLVRRRGGPLERVAVYGLLASVRGAILAGQGVTVSPILSAGLDYDWGSVAARLRGLTLAGTSADGGLARRDSEVGLALVLQRFVDLPRVSVGFGVGVEEARMMQTFDTRAELGRASWMTTFGGFLAVERQLPGGFALRLEGGPNTALFRRVTTRDGVAVGTTWDTPLTWRAAGGLEWRH